MIIPVRCFTCGKVIANMYDHYAEEVKKLEQSGAKSQHPHFIGAPTGDILTSLGLTRMCCRKMMIGHVEHYHLLASSLTNQR